MHESNVHNLSPAFREAISLIWIHNSLWNNLTIAPRLTQSPVQFQYPIRKLIFYLSILRIHKQPIQVISDNSNKPSDRKSVV